MPGPPRFRREQLSYELRLRVVERPVLFLQVTGIRQQNTAEVDRGRRGINRTAKSTFYQSRNPAAMVQMGVSQNHMLNVSGGHRQVLPIALAPFFLSLEQA